MIETPEWTRPHINVTYPASNKLIFEEWLYGQQLPETEREYLPIFWTSYWVNNDYGNDLVAKQKMQDYVNSLDRNKKYWTVWQYDNGTVVDISHLDILTFGMSYREEKDKPNVNLPLIGEWFKLEGNFDRKYKGCFVGSITDPIRNKMIEALKGRDGYFISTHPMTHEDYHEVLAQSTFALAPRGYGLPSFRAFEAMRYGTIPVYISDRFQVPYDLQWGDFGIAINDSELAALDAIINMYDEPTSIKRLQKRIHELNETHFTYEGCRNQIIRYLISE